MSEPWHKFCLQEIDLRLERGTKKPNAFEKEFLDSVRKRIDLGMSLSERQENTLRKIHERYTELRKIKW